MSSTHNLLFGNMPDNPLPHFRVAKQITAGGIKQAISRFQAISMTLGC